jgi:FkbM family methyltransferase
LSTVLRSDQRRIQRKGISYEVDLTEGIDLSLFAFGNFQDHITNPRYFSLPADAVIIDVGANIGSMALRFAQSAPAGKIYALEPTAYAYKKLQRNLALNPELSARINPKQTFVSNVASGESSIVAYSSWKVDGTATDVHPLHGGAAQAADSVGVTTIDEFCELMELPRLDLIKIDTDGHELPVLQGAQGAIEKYSPHIIFEMSLYALEENNVTFEDYLNCLKPFGYTLLNSRNGKTISMENYLKEIPLRSTIDIFALPPAGN